MPIELRDVFHLYARKTPFEHMGLENINLKLTGEYRFIALIGHTGSGKSTLVQHLNGLLLPTSGEIQIDDFKVTPKKKKNKHIKSLRKHVGLVFQFPEYQLFEETVLKDVAFGPKNFGVKEEEALKKAKKALNDVGIGEEYFNRSPFELSGGERRRVAIAGIIALEPKILVLDEPTAGLDPQGVKEMMALFQTIHKMHTDIFMITHNMDHVLEYADYAIVMKDGKIVKEDTPIKLFTTHFDDSLSLEIPAVLRFANALKTNGLDIDISNIKNIETLVSAIIKAREAHE